MRFAALLVLTARLHAQPPAINQEGVFNAASRMPPSLPGGAMAPGSRIVIQGLRFEPDSEVRLGTTQLRTLSIAPTRIEALLPRQVSPGRAAVTVSNRDGVSRPFEILITTAALGLYSANDKSWGPARMDRPYVLTGTGLGAERHPEIFAGSRRARLIRVGAHPSEAGMDEIEFAPDPATPEGCFVPVLARLSNGMVSNTVAVPIGRCTPPQLHGDQFLMLARILAHIRPYSLRAVDFTEDFGAAVFAPETVIATLLNPWRLLPPVGLCTAYTGPFYSDVGESTLSGFFSGIVGAQGRDSGRVVMVRGNGAEEPLPRAPTATGFYTGVLGVDKPLQHPGPPLFLSPGDYTLSWTGGSQRLTMPPSFTWTNAGRLETLDRAAGVTVEWRANPLPRMGIVAVSVDPDTTAMAACFCLGAGASGKFHIPPEMMANIPPTRREQRLPTSLLMLVPLPDNPLAFATTIRAQSVMWK